MTARATAGVMAAPTARDASGAVMEAQRRRIQAAIGRQRRADPAWQAAAMRVAVGEQRRIAGLN